MIIKPDAVKAGLIGEILAQILREGFEIRAMRMLTMDTKQARDFYAVHQGKPFYDDLVEFMTSGKVVVCALFRENAVLHYRKVIGATNWQNAEPGTVRRKWRPPFKTM